MAEYKIRFTQVRPYIYAPRWGCETRVASPVDTQKGQMTIKDLAKLGWSFWSRDTATATYMKKELAQPRHMVGIEITKSRSKKFPGYFAMRINNELTGYFGSIEAILVRLKLTGLVPLKEALASKEGASPK